MTDVRAAFNISLNWTADGLPSHGLATATAASYFSR